MSPPPIDFPVPGLEGGGIRLRLMAEADVDDVVAAAQDPDLRRFTTVPDSYGEDEARQWRRTSQAGIDSGTDLTTVVVDAEDGGLLGAVGLHNIDPETGRCAAGYWVAPWARGRGIAARGLDLISRFAFAELGVSRIELWIEPENAPSLLVAERAGFTREGLLRSFAVIDGRRRDMLMYSRIAGDPPVSGDRVD